jgi:transcriptional antiterminator RfaH
MTRMPVHKIPASKVPASKVPASKIAPPRSSPHWYVVQTRHLSEARAAHELEAQGFNVFLPRFLKRRSHARKVTWAPAPLFVSLDPAVQRWRSVNGTHGVVRLVSGDDGPAPIASSIVEELMARRDGNGYIALPQRPVFDPGEAVRIVYGSFENAMGLFEDFTDQDRVAVLLELLGRKVRVVLDEGMIEKAA